MQHDTTITAAVRGYLATQRLGRLATVDAHGAPQNNPVTFRVTDDGSALVGGRHMGDTRKFRNVGANPHVAFVVDDLASVQPWRVRYVEIRGTAEALSDAEPPMPGMSREVIRITPRVVLSFGIDDGG